MLQPVYEGGEWRHIVLVIKQMYLLAVISTRLSVPPQRYSGVLV